MRRLLVVAAVLFAACRGATRAPSGGAAPHASSYELRVGQQTFQTYCAGCHGDTGQGDGFNSFNLDPHPRDLSDPAFQKSKSNRDLEDAVRRGGAGVGLSALMPPWGHTLDQRHIAAVVLYVRSLRRGAIMK